MIALEDRQALVQDIGAAQSAGARLSKACEVCGIDRRTLHRWKADAIALQSGDRRPMAIRPTPAHALAPEERARVLSVANEPRFADRPPARIVSALDIMIEGPIGAGKTSLARRLAERLGAELLLEQPGENPFRLSADRNGPGLPSLGEGNMQRVGSPVQVSPAGI